MLADFALIIFFQLDISLQRVPPEHIQQNHESEEGAYTLIELCSQLPRRVMAQVKNTVCRQLFRKDRQCARFVESSAPKEQQSHDEVQPCNLLV